MQIQIISEITSVLEKKNYTSSDVVHAMVNFRKLLELGNLEQQFSVLNLYCNWCVHTIIDQSNVAFRILDFLTDAIINETSPGAPPIVNVISQGCKLHVLRDEIIEVSRIHGITPGSKFRDLDTWEIYASALVTHLLGTPIAFPTTFWPRSGAKRIYDSIMAKTATTNYAVVQFKFVKYAWGGFGWEFLNKVGAMFHGPLEFH